MAVQQELFDFDLGDEVSNENGFNCSYQTEVYAHRETLDANIAKGFIEADLIPFFFPNKRSLSITGAATAEDTTRVRVVEVNGMSARLDQTAANVKPRAGKHKGKRIYRHLGSRELNVLDALKYIASCSPGKFGVLKGQAALKFTIGMIQKCLGGSLNSAEIADALDVLNGSLTELRIYNGEKVKPIKSTLLPLLISVEDEHHSDLFDEKDNYTWVCTFHPLFTKDACSLKYRLWDQQRIKSRTSYLAEWLEKKLSLKFIQAGENRKYSIKGSTILLGAGLPYDPSLAPSTNFKSIDKKALLELVLPEGIDINSEEAKQYIIRKVEINNIYSVTPTRAKKVTDCMYHFYAMPHFGEQQKVANAISNREKERMFMAKESRVPVRTTPNLRLISKPKDDLETEA